MMTKLHNLIVFPFWYLMYHGDENPVRMWKEYWRLPND